LRNWRLKVDNFESSSHADQPDRGFENRVELRASKTGDNEKIKDHDSENMTVRIGTEYAAFE
jgi:hypothetical protein